MIIGTCIYYIIYLSIALQHKCRTPGPTATMVLLCCHLSALLQLTITNHLFTSFAGVTKIVKISLCFTNHKKLQEIKTRKIAFKY